MSEDKIKDIICKMNQNYMQLFEIWNETSLKSLSLTTVGIVLGIMHIKRITGENIDMNIWLIISNEEMKQITLWIKHKFQ